MIEVELGKVVQPDRPRISPSEMPHLPFIGMEHVEAHTMRILGSVPSSEMRSSAVHFQSGDVLYGRLRPYLNKVCRPNFEGLCSAEFIVFSKNENLDSKYLQYFLNSSHFVAFATHLNEGDRPRVKFEQLASFPFPFISLRQQKQIVAEIEKQLSRLDETVANLKRVKANLKRYKASVLQAAVTGKLTEEWRKQHPDVEPASKLLERILIERRQKWEEAELAKMRAKGQEPKNDKWKEKYKVPSFPETSSLSELPVEWAWTSTEQLSDITGGLTQNKKREQYVAKMSFLRVANVYANELRLDEVLEIGVLDTELERVLLRKGDLLVVEGNGSPEQIGRLAIWDDSVAPCVHQNHLIKIRLLMPEMGKLVLYWLLSLQGRQCIKAVANSTTGLYTLSISKVSHLPSPLAPLREQQVIIQEVESRLSVAEKIERTVDANLKRADRLRQSILKQAFSGKLI